MNYCLDPPSETPVIHTEIERRFYNKIINHKNLKNMTGLLMWKSQKKLYLHMLFKKGSNQHWGSSFMSNGFYMLQKTTRLYHAPLDFAQLENVRKK